MKRKWPSFKDISVCLNALEVARETSTLRNPHIRLESKYIAIRDCFVVIFVYHYYLRIYIFLFCKNLVEDRKKKRNEEGITESMEKRKKRSEERKFF
jgi:hypothetical protein